MMRGMYAAISGLEAHQTMLDVVANNLANADTSGYKAQRTTFVDELSQTLAAANGPNGNLGGSGPTQVGLGVQVGSIDNMMAAGSLQSTGNPTDVAIQGDGFLRVATGNPPAQPTANQLVTNFSNVQYTRAGDLKVNPDGYLTNPQGFYVVGRVAVASGAPPNVTYTPTPNNNANGDTYIYMPPGSTGVAVGQDGSVSYLDPNTQQRVTAGYLSLATFPDEAGLQRMGGSMWQATPNSGQPTIGTPGTAGTGLTIAGTLEMSNVDMATEFTNMIQAQRGYQANASVITTGDQMLQTLVQMKP